MLSGLKVSISLQKLKRLIGNVCPCENEAAEESSSWGVITFLARDESAMEPEKQGQVQGQPISKPEGGNKPRDQSSKPARRAGGVRLHMSR